MKLDTAGVERAAWDAGMALVLLGVCAFCAPYTDALTQSVLGMVLVELALVMLTVLLLRFRVDGALGLGVAIVSSIVLVFAVIHYQRLVGVWVLVPTLAHVWRTYKLWHGAMPAVERRAHRTFTIWSPAIFLASLFLVGGLAAAISQVLGEPERLEGLGDFKRVLLWVGATYYLGMATLKYLYKVSWPEYWGEPKNQSNRARARE